MSSETNHSLVTDPFLERNEKIFHMPSDTSHIEKVSSPRRSFRLQQASAQGNGSHVKSLPWTELGPEANQN